MPPFLASGLSRIPPCYLTVPSTFSLAGYVGDFPIPIAGTHPTTCHQLSTLLLLDLVKHRPEGLYLAPVVRLVWKGSGVGTFRIDARTRFAFSTAPNPSGSPNGANPQRRSDPECLISLSTRPNPPRRFLLLSLATTHGLLGRAIRYLINRTHFSQMHSLSIPDTKHLRLLAALGC